MSIYNIYIERYVIESNDAYEDLNWTFISKSNMTHRDCMNPNKI